ncbi:hypothetical protein J437_LFUL012504 [Ladona fulva]|uniref:Uncharacterized protein n=1 Tax=Ladona fulva TaxID=123851 RepID=A0A8K0K5K5_LADFU|nr:hypothetical protein J437_LFUL012504 [Ladona fulva]
MPGLIGVSEFVEETREDYNSPTTSTFVSRIPQFRQTIAALEENVYYQLHAALSEKLLCDDELEFSVEMQYGS